MDLIQSDEEGKFIIDGPTLVKTLLLTLFGIAAALTIIKFVSYLIYKCYVKCCKNKCCCKEKKGKNSDKNQNQQVLSRRGSRRSLHTLHQTPLVLRADVRKKSLNPSTFIQIQPEENISTEHSGLFYLFLFFQAYLWYCYFSRVWEGQLGNLIIPPKMYFSTKTFTCRRKT